LVFFFENMPSGNPALGSKEDLFAGFEKNGCPRKEIEYFAYFAAGSGPVPSLFRRLGD
jgi:hypothetical protein